MFLMKAPLLFASNFMLQTCGIILIIKKKESSKLIDIHSSLIIWLFNYVINRLFNFYTCSFI